MINIKEFIYNKIKNNTEINWLVWGRIFAWMAPVGTGFPLIIYNRIWWSKIDLKWIRNEYFQISIWWSWLSENEIITFKVVKLFNGIKEWNVKITDIQRIDESFDNETKSYWIHLTIHLKIFDNLL